MQPGDDGASDRLHSNISASRLQATSCYSKDDDLVSLRQDLLPPAPAPNPQTPKGKGQSLDKATQVLQPTLQVSRILLHGTVISLSALRMRRCCHQ